MNLDFSFFTAGERERYYPLCSALLLSISCLEFPPLSSSVVQGDLFSIFSPLSFCSDIIRLAPSVLRRGRCGMPPVSILHQPQLTFNSFSVSLLHSFQVIRHGLQHFRNADIFHIRSLRVAPCTHQHLLLSMLLSTQNIYPRIYKYSLEPGE